MTFMPMGEPRSVPDPWGDLYDRVILRRLPPDPWWGIFDQAPHQMIDPLYRGEAPAWRPPIYRRGERPRYRLA